jgi:hypothetical protein
MTSDSGLREDTHPVGGIPLKEITGVVQFVMTNQVLKKGDLVIQDHLLGRGRESIGKVLMVKNPIHQKVSEPLIMKT